MQLIIHRSIISIIKGILRAILIKSRCEVGKGRTERRSRRAIPYVAVQVIIRTQRDVALPNVEGRGRGHEAKAVLHGKRVIIGICPFLHRPACLVNCQVVAPPRIAVQG